MEKPHLPRGNRVDDQPELKGWQGVKFRLALMTRRYPVQIALAIALLICAYPVWLLVAASNNLKTAQQELRDAVVTTNATRVVSSSAYCTAIRNNTITSDAIIDFLVRTIQDSPRPPGQTQAEREAMQEFASGLASLKRVPLDCDKFKAQIEKDTAKIAAAGTP